MASQSSLYSVDGTTKTYPQTKHIATKQHAIVYSRITGSANEWVRVSELAWRLINNSIVLSEPIDGSLYDQIEIRVADEANELTDSISDIAALSSISDSILLLAAIKPKLDSLYADKVNLDTIALDLLEPISEINTVAENISNVNTVSGWVNTGLPQILVSTESIIIDKISDLSIVPAGITTALVKDYHNGIEGGGGIFVWDATKIKSDHNGGTIVDPAVAFPLDWTNKTQLQAWFDGSINSTLGCWVRKFDGAVNIKWFGAIDGQDSTVAIQSCLNEAKNGMIADRGVYIPSGTFLVSESIRLHTGTKLHGEGHNSQIKANNLQFGANYINPSDIQSYGQITLPQPPIFYNPTPIQWWAIENISLHGNGEQIIGLCLYGAYYGKIENIVIFETMEKAYIGIRNQLVNFTNFTIYRSGGWLMYNSSSINIEACGIERTKNETWAFDFRQPIGFNKGSLSMNSCWFETEITDALGTPAINYIRVGGRNNTIANTLMSHVGTTGIMLKLMEEANAFTYAGLNMASTASAYSTYQILLAANAGQTLVKEIGSGSYHNVVKGWAPTDIVTTQNYTNNLSEYKNEIPTNIMAAFQVRRPSQISAINGFVMSVDSQEFASDGIEKIRLFGSDDTYLRNNSGILEMQANTTLRLRAKSGGIAVQPASGSNFVVEGQNYAEKHLVLGTHHIWVDITGVLRIKNGVPTSDLDGVAVGAQV